MSDLGLHTYSTRRRDASLLQNLFILRHLHIFCHEASRFWPRTISIPVFWIGVMPSKLQPFCSPLVASDGTAGHWQSSALIPSQQRLAVGYLPDQWLVCAVAIHPASNVLTGPESAVESS